MPCRPLRMHPSAIERFKSWSLGSVDRSFGGRRQVCTRTTPPLSATRHVDRNARAQRPVRLSAIDHPDPAVTAAQPVPRRYTASSDWRVRPSSRAFGRAETENSAQVPQPDAGHPTPRRRSRRRARPGPRPTRHPCRSGRGCRRPAPSPPSGAGASSAAGTAWPGYPWRHSPASTSRRPKRGSAAGGTREPSLPVSQRPAISVIARLPCIPVPQSVYRPGLPSGTR